MIFPPSVKDFFSVGTSTTAVLRAVSKNVVDAEAFGFNATPFVACIPRLSFLSFALALAVVRCTCSHQYVVSWSEREHIVKRLASVFVEARRRPG